MTAGVEPIIWFGGSSLGHRRTAVVFKEAFRASVYRVLEQASAKAGE